MRFVEKCFYRWGKLVAQTPAPFLLGPILISLVSSLGALHFWQEPDIWKMYSPEDAPMMKERELVHDYTLITAQHFYRIQILALRRSTSLNQSLFNTDYLSELMAFNELVEDTQFTTIVADEHKEQNMSYMQLCGLFCESDQLNSRLLRILRFYMLNTTDPNVFMRFPTALVMNQEVFLGYSLGGLTLNARHVVTDFNLLLLHYNINQQHEPRIAQIFDKTMFKLVEAFNLRSRDLRLLMYSQTADVQAQNELPMSVLPLLPLTVFILLCFAIFTLLTRPLSASQCIEGCMGVVGPGMAVASTFGTLWAIGYPYTNVLAVVPFIILVIGMDDAFLILAGWRETDGSLSVSERIGQSLAAAGTSVTITSLTDILCFLVGTCSSMPVVRLFSIYTAAALFLDYLYQLTFFVAIMALVGKQRILMQSTSTDDHHNHRTANLLARIQRAFMIADSSLNFKKSMKHESNARLPVTEADQASSGDTSSSVTSDSISNSSQTSRWSIVESIWRRLLDVRGRTARFICTSFVFTVYSAQLLVSIYAASFGNVDFTLPRMFLATSQMAETTARIEHQLLYDCYVVNYVCHYLPDFGNMSTRQHFLTMVNELETIDRFAIGHRGTRLWVRSYEAHVRFIFNDVPSAWTSSHILSNDSGLSHRWFRIKQPEQQIVGFWWTTSYQNMSNILDLAVLVHARRAITAKYPVFHVTGTHDLDKMADISEAVPGKLLQTTGTAVLLMSVLVFMFVRDLAACFWVLQSLFTIGVGTIGFLQFWSVQLDGISMISILLAVGVTVDYTAHVCYHFYTHAHWVQLSAHSAQYSHKEQCHLRVQLLLDVYRAAGWPILQGNLANVCGMMPLVLVNGYIVQVFWKTVLLISALAFFQSHIMLPLCFVTFVPLRPVRHQQLDFDESEPNQSS